MSSYLDTTTNSALARQFHYDEEPIVHRSQSFQIKFHFEIGFQESSHFKLELNPNAVVEILRLIIGKNFLSIQSQQAKQKYVVLIGLVTSLGTNFIMEMACGTFNAMRATSELAPGGTHLLSIVV